MSELNQINKIGIVYKVLGGFVTLIATVGVGPSLLNKIWQENKPPSAKITATKQAGTVPFELLLDGAKSVDPEGRELKFKWIVNNEVSSDKESYRHLFKEPGEYSVVLEVRDPKGLQSRDSIFVNVLSREESPSGETAKKTPEELKNIALPAEQKEAPISPSGTSHPANSVDPLAMTAAHNRWRSTVRVPDLIWSDELAKAAQELADDLRDRGCTTSHSKNSYNENIFRAGAIVYSNGRREFKKKTPQEVTEKWSSGNASYNNIIRDDTNKIGCAMSVCKDNSQIWVCYYYPPGNIVGQKPY